MAWIYQPQQLRDILESAGFDVDTSAAILSGGGSLSARRQRGEQATVVSVDAGGRFRATLTAVVETPPSTTGDVAGVQVRIVSELTRTTTISGHLTTPDQLGPLLQALPSLAAKQTERTMSWEAPGTQPAPDRAAVSPMARSHTAPVPKGRPWWRPWR